MTTQQEAQDAVVKSIPKGFRLYGINFSRTTTHLVVAYEYASTASATVGGLQKAKRQFPL